MALKKSEKRLLIILGIVVLAAIVNFYLEGQAKKKEAAERAAQRKQAVQVNKTVPAGKTGSFQQVQTTAVSPDRITYKDWGHDPFAGSVTQRAVQAARAPKEKPIESLYELKGIFWKNGKGYVLINEEVIGEGEEADGLRVERIEGTRVLCSARGRTFTLNWSETS